LRHPWLRCKAILRRHDELLLQARLLNAGLLRQYWHARLLRHSWLRWHARLLRYPRLRQHARLLRHAKLLLHPVLLRCP